MLVQTLLSQILHTTGRSLAMRIMSTGKRTGAAAAASLVLRG
jgi:hypothetical protein